MSKINKNHLEPNDVKEGDIVVVYFTLMQHMYGGFADTLKVSTVDLDGYHCHARVSPLFAPLPFTIDDVIAIYRRSEGETDYKLIWYDEKHKEDL